MATNFKFDLPAQNTFQLSREVRDNMEALGTTNLTVDPTKPKNPRNGMFRILHTPPSTFAFQYFFSSSWRTIFISEDGSSSARRKEFVITSPSSIWTIDHNLANFPLVQALDSGDSIVTPQQIQHTSVNRVIITHSSPITGKVIVIG